MSKCRQCKQSFIKQRPLQDVCGYVCGLLLAKAKREKEERKDFRERKAKIKSRSAWLKEAQQVFNVYIRARDRRLPCISCGRFHKGQWHAGHYLSVGARPELRFDEANTHRQCSACNNYLSGNIALYRISLLKRIGLVDVERLEGPNGMKKYTIEDLKQIISTYKAKIKALEIQS